MTFVIGMKQLHTVVCIIPPNTFPPPWIRNTLVTPLGGYSSPQVYTSSAQVTTATAPTWCLSRSAKGLAPSPKSMPDSCYGTFSAKGFGETLITTIRDPWLYNLLVNVSSGTVVPFRR